MDVKLVVIGGKSAGKEIPVPGPKFFIGRSEDCQLRPQTDLVSRHHCVILAEEGFVAVRDLGSKNGTLVNGEMIRTERELKTGDHLKVGPLEFEVRLSVQVGGKKKPKVQSVGEAAARTAQRSVASDDMDISDWLEDEQPGPGQSEGDDTHRLAPKPAPATPDAVPAEAASAREQPPGKQPPMKLVGRSQTPAKPVAESSRAAAADMLKQLFDPKKQR